MSFFGLTAFGPESLVKSTLVNSNGFTLYFDSDYQRAFNEMTKKNQKNTIQVKDLKELMTLTMGFPPLDEEVAIFKKFSGKQSEEDCLTWPEITEILNAIRNNLNEIASKSTKYQSFQKYYDDTYKHIRKDVNPNTIYKSPNTYGQNYGFYHFETHDLNNIHFPKRQCDETKYADCLVRSNFK